MLRYSTTLLSKYFLTKNKIAISSIPNLKDFINKQSAVSSPLS